MNAEMSWTSVASLANAFFAGINVVCLIVNVIIWRDRRHDR